MADRKCEFCGEKVEDDFPMTFILCDKCYQKLKGTDFFDGPGEGGV